ncbi:MAG TPA: hypothetical protein VN721_16900 [Flavipsychrobacter sp.]|nr:hypothetical protein [Flavipsychrobacter sp.]
MRIIIATFFIAILAFVVEYYWPWWIIAVVAFVIIFLFNLNPGRGFIAGFLGIAICWLAVALWRDTLNEHILSQRMATLFGLPHYTLFIVLTVFLGGLTGGLAGWSGSQTRRIFN